MRGPRWRYGRRKKNKQFRYFSTKCTGKKAPETGDVHPDLFTPLSMDAECCKKNKYLQLFEQLPHERSVMEQKSVHQKVRYLFSRAKSCNLEETFSNFFRDDGVERKLRGATFRQSTHADPLQLRSWKVVITDMPTNTKLARCLMNGIWKKVMPSAVWQCLWFARPSTASSG